MPVPRSLARRFATAFVTTAALASAGCRDEGPAASTVRTDAVTGPVTATGVGAPSGGPPAAPAIPSVADECGGPAPAVRRVVLRTRPDVVRIAAAQVGSGPTAVVLVHQTDTTLCEWLPYARRLAAGGHRAIAIDLRAHGVSDAAPARVMGRFDLDVAAAVRHARGRGARRVGLVGASLGGTVVLTAAAGVRPPVDAVVSLSGPARWPDLDAVRAVRGLRMPVLLVAGADDVQFARDARALAKADPRADLLMLPTFEHGVQLMEPGSPAERRVNALIASVSG